MFPSSIDLGECRLEDFEPQSRRDISADFGKCVEPSGGSQRHVGVIAGFGELLGDPIADFGRLCDLLSPDLIGHGLSLLGAFGFPQVSFEAVAEGLFAEGIDEVLEELSMGRFSHFPVADPPEHGLQVLVDRKVGRLVLGLFRLDGQGTLQHSHVVDAELFEPLDG